MANKKFLWVIPVIALVLGMTVVGCGDDESEPVIKKNNTISSVSISLYFGDTIPKVGNALSTTVKNSDGTWVDGVTYLWKRADSQNGTFTNISGATSSKYTPVSEDAGKWIKVEVTNSDTPAPVLSDAVGPVDANQTAKPTADPAGPNVVTGQEIILSSTTEDAIIRYTIDGSTPTSSSSQYVSYQKPKITSSCTLKAIAIKFGMVDSEVLSISYTVVTAPSFTAVSTTGFTTGIYSVAYGNNRYVAGGSNRIAYSTNGTTWTTSSGFSNFLVKGITYGGTQFVAVGYYSNGGLINYSSDGKSWNNVATTSFGTSDINNVAYGGGRYVAVGEDGKIAYSTNATSWTAVTASTFGESDIYGVTYGNGKFVAVGENGKMAYSTDGTKWTAIDSTTFPPAYPINGVTYGGASGNEKFIAVGDSVLGYQIAYSTDGETWTKISQSIYSDNFTASLNRVKWGGNKFVAVASQGVMYYSTDGTYWGKIEGGTGTGKSQFDNAVGSAVKDIVYAGGKFLAVGSKFVSLTSSTGEIAISNVQ